VSDCAVPLPICPGAALEDGGRGVRFEVSVSGRRTPAFVIRYGGHVYGYLNQCAHVPMELDWSEGQFFETSGLYLMCATHGATYEPDTGHCIGGPCRGGALQPVRVEERLTDPDGGDATRTTVVWWPDAYIEAPEPPAH
jgi:nitrite reductase/ring-hydroxylating ferredoxin subunit